MMCDDAGCDAASSHDGASPSDDGEVEEPEPDSAPPDEHDAGAQPETDAGNSSPGADAGSDAGDLPVDHDAGGSDAGSNPAQDAGSDAQVSSDAGSSNDAGVSTDSGVTGDSGVTTDSGSGSTFVPVRFSASDHGASALFSSDHWSVENRGEDRGNARSDSAIAPGAGVFYFEAERKIDTVGYYGVGIATAGASLTGEMGTTADSIGMFTSGDFADSTATCTGSPGFQDPSDKHFYGYVVDYRGASPRILYLLDDGAGGVEIRRTCATTITAPVFIFYSGARWEVGYQIRINTGSDTVNLPFHFSDSQVKAALNAASETALANAVVFGFGKTRALPLSADPLLSPPGNRTVAPGSSVTLTGSASDAEDGNLTSSIRWTDISSQHHAQVTGSGGSFTFTATLGRHPILMSVTDSVGRTTEVTVMVDAGGTPASAGTVKLVYDALSGADTTISSDGLSVDVHASTKNGVRANQAIYGQYWYFEARRNGSAQNEGVGLVIPDGSLDPYDFVNVPWSMSINLTGSVWYNLNSIPGWAPPTPSASAASTYGFAVDYRGQHPLVHIIIGGVYDRTLEMKDVWGPLHPMAYGNPFYLSPDVDPGDDITLNFGASAFAFNPATILGPTRASGLLLGWGVHAH